MQNLPRVSHEHHDRLWHYVVQLDELADRLSSDSLDTTRLIEELPDLRELHDGLGQELIAMKLKLEGIDDKTSGYKHKIEYRMNASTGIDNALPPHFSCLIQFLH